MSALILTTALTPSGYCCTCDALPGWMVAHEGDFEAFKAYVEESLDFYIEGLEADGEPIPAELQGERRVEYRFDMQSLLEHLRPLFTFSALERLTGIHQKQLAHYAAGRSTPRPAQAEKFNAALHALGERLTAVRV